MSEKVFKLLNDKFIISEGYGSTKKSVVGELRKIDKMYQSGQLSQSEYDRFKDYERGIDNTKDTDTSPEEVDKTSTPSAPEGSIAQKIISVGYTDAHIILNQIKDWGNKNGISFDDEKLGDVTRSTST